MPGWRGTSIYGVTKAPIKFVGVGEKLDALEPFHPERMAGRILQQGDILSLVEKAQATVDAKEAERLAKKATSRKGLDLQDFLTAMRQMQKMGPIKNVLGMLPGVNMAALSAAQVDDKRLTHVEAIVLSMTPKERGRSRSHQRIAAAPDREGIRPDGAGSESVAGAVQADAKLMKSAGKPGVQVAVRQRVSRRDVRRQSGIQFKDGLAWQRGSDSAGSAARACRSIASSSPTASHRGTARFIATIGTYNPKGTNDAEKVRVDGDQAKAWLAKGATPTDTGQGAPDQGRRGGLTMSGEPRHLVVGRLRKPHGLKGEFTVFPLTDDPATVFQPGRALRRMDLAGTMVGEPVEVERSKAYHREWLIKFRGVESRDEHGALEGPVSGGSGGHPGEAGRGRGLPPRAGGLRGPEQRWFGVGPGDGPL